MTKAKQFVSCMLAPANRFIFYLLSQRQFVCLIKFTYEGMNRPVFKNKKLLGLREKVHTGSNKFQQVLLVTVS